MSIELRAEGVSVKNHKNATFRDMLVAAAIRCTNFWRYEACREGLDIEVCGSRIVEPIKSSAFLAHLQGCRYILHVPSSLSIVSEPFVKRRRSETARCSSA